VTTGRPTTDTNAAAHRLCKCWLADGRRHQTRSGPIDVIKRERRQVTGCLPLADLLPFEPRFIKRLTWLTLELFKFVSATLCGRLAGFFSAPLSIRTTMTTVMGQF
jgi:hypothetical protein